jgi:hypothetical protein
MAVDGDNGVRDMYLTKGVFGCLCPQRVTSHAGIRGKAESPGARGNCVHARVIEGPCQWQWTEALIT